MKSKEEQKAHIEQKINRFRFINYQHQCTINNYCSDVRQLRKMIKENEELIEELENEILFGKDKYN